MDRSILDEINETEPKINDATAEPIEPPKGIDISFLKAKTGTGSIGDYVDHPLNFNKSNGMAQMIRGATGLLGALDLAVIDIFVGLLQFSKERKAVTNVN